MFEWLKCDTAYDLPFEFGPILQRDRKQLSANLRYNNQGDLLKDNALPSNILQSSSTPLNASAVANSVFFIFQHLFKKRTVRKFLKHQPIVGVMSNSLAVNGLAGRLHNGESKHYVNVTAGTMLQGTVALYRLFGDQTFQQNGGLEVLDATSCFYQDESFHIPKNLAIRKYAMECATYGALAVFCHELAHVFRGHTSLMSSKLGIGMLDETALPTSSTHIDLRRLIEIDADDFAGKFLADILFPTFLKNRDLLTDKDGTNKFLQVSAGVLALYLGFGTGNSVYYSGFVRANLVLSSLLLRCSNDKSSASWLRGQIAQIQKDMISAKLISNNHIANYDHEIHDLINTAMPERDKQQKEWLHYRQQSNDLSLQ